MVEQTATAGNASPVQWNSGMATWLALLTVLVFYPGLRMAVGYFDITPVPEGQAGWWSLWGGILIGHWLCAAVVLWAVSAEKGGLKSIGLDLGIFIRRRTLFLTLLAIVAVAGYLVPGYFYGETYPEQMRSHPLGPVTPMQRLFWILMALTAGFVEEIAYRGYAITRLRRWIGLPLAIVVSLIGFALMHGPSVFIPSLLMLYLVAGTLFTVAFIWMGSRRLEVLIIVHVAIDMMLVIAP